MLSSATESLFGTETSSIVVAAEICQEPYNIPCPRCNSTRTKFCYYNNYKRAQPRYLCFECCRHFTRGGSLRNVPVGSASRKNNPKRKKKNQAVLHFISSDPTPSQNAKTEEISVSSPSCSSGSFENMEDYDDLDLLNCSNRSFTSLLKGDCSINIAVLNYGLGNGTLIPDVKMGYGNVGGNVDSNINNNYYNNSNGYNNTNGYSLLDSGVTAEYYYWPDLAMSTPAPVSAQGLQ